MSARNDFKKKLISIVASVALVVGFMPLPAVAIADDGASNTGNQNTATQLTAGTIANEETALVAGSQETGAKVQVDTWDGLQNAIKNANDKDVIQLSGDVVNPGGKDRIQVENKSITIDLAGNTLNRNLTSKKDNGHVIEVFTGATLTIKDSVGGGKITGGYSKYGGGIYVSGTLIMTGGTITNNNAVEFGGGIYVTSSGKIDLSNATITTNNAREKDGGGIYTKAGNDSTIKNCSITDNMAGRHGGGLYVDSKGKTLTIEDSHIDKNSAGSNGGGINLYWGTIDMKATKGGVCTLSNNSAACAGGIKVTSSTTFIATDVTISSNRAKNEEGGGIKNYGTTSLTRCTVETNTAKKAGGGVFNNQENGKDSSLGALTIDDCTISGNNSEKDGGGIYSDKKLTINGGTINENAAGSGKGNGVFIDSSSADTLISGKLVVKGNGPKDSGSLDNMQQLYLAKDKKLKLTSDAKLTTGTQIGVTLEGEKIGTFTTGFGASGIGDTPNKYFFSPEGYDVVSLGKGNAAEAQLKSGWKDLQNEITSKEDDSDPSNNFVTLDKDYTAGPEDESLQINKDFTIDLNGHTLNRNLSSRASNGNVIEMSWENGQTLTIKDSSQAKTGKITGGFSGEGGGIYVGSKTTLIFEGGTITGNTASLKGGGIYVDDFGTLNMTGGTITKNVAGEDDDEIKANPPFDPKDLEYTARYTLELLNSGFGGGIYVHASGSDKQAGTTTVQLSNVTISDNKAKKTGGGIEVCQGFSNATNCSITNCSITGNESGGNGGGIHMNGKDEKISITDTNIESNESGDDGGGISLENGTIVMEATKGGTCSLSNNKASNDGAGAKIEGNYTFFTATDVAITGNQAKKEEGGGVKNHGTATLTRCTIIENTSKNEGGGVYNSANGSSKGELTLDSCTISGNSSNSNGGGVYSDKKLTIKGGAVAENKAVGGKGDGVYIGSHSEATDISGGIVIQGNTANPGTTGTDLYLREGKKLHVVGKLTGTKISSIDMDKIGTFTDGYSGEHSESPNEFFGTADGAYPVGWTEDKKEARLLSSWPDLQNEITSKENDDNQENIITLSQGYTAATGNDRLQIRKNFTIDLNGHTLNRHLSSKTRDGHVIEVFNGATLTIKDSKGGGVLTGGYSNAGGAIFVNKGATLVFKGGTITGNNAGVEGGGIYVNGGGKLELKGGTISENHAEEKGGGIFVKGALEMTGGVIDGNTAHIPTLVGFGKGGGIFVEDGGTLSITGGTISGNSSNMIGGGIAVVDGGTISQLKGATITGNSSFTGGGTYITSLKADSLTIENCAIASNTSSDEGGGMYLAVGDKTLAIKGSHIEGNSAGGSGGGLYMDAKGSTLTIENSHIDNNSAGGSGGGINLYWGTIDMKAVKNGTCSLSNNTAASGGGVKVTSSTTFNATSVTIDGNKALTDEGGGIKNFGTTSLTKCTVERNTAKRAGGGVYSIKESGNDHSLGDLTLDTCGFKENSSQTYGGAVFASDKLAIKGGSFTENSAGVGGGIFIGAGAKTIGIQGGLVVKDNTTPYYGNNMYLSKGTKLALTDKLTDGAEIGVDLAGGTGILTSGYCDKCGENADPAKHFVVATGYDMFKKDREVEIGSSWNTLKDRIESAKDGETVKLEKDLDRDFAASFGEDRIKIPAGKHITVDLNGHTLNRNKGGSFEITNFLDGPLAIVGPWDSNGHVFEVFGTLTLQDGKGIGTITGGWSEKGGGIYIHDGGKLNLKSGTISGNRAHEKGGGIYMEGGATLNMEGGTVKGNEAQDNGGGINVSKNGIFYLAGGTVTNNKTEKRGGGIMADEFATVSVKGSPVVNGNNAARAGYDVYLAGTNKLQITDKLTKNARISVAIESDWGVFTSGYGTHNPDVNPATYFVSRQGYAVLEEGDEAKLGLNTYGETDYEKPFIDRNNQVDTNTEDLTGANWMSGISGERYLNEINMPGSHDSGMRSVEWFPSLMDVTSAVGFFFYDKGSYYATTQTLYIDQQFEAGARQLDIRVSDRYKKEYWYELGRYDWADDGTNLWVCHGTNKDVGTYYATYSDGDHNYKLSFSQVIDWAKDFLEKHPTETVILGIKPETSESGHSGTIYQRARKLLEASALAINHSTGEPFLYKESGSSSYFAPYNYMPQLKDCRGKIVILPASDEGVEICGGFRGQNLSGITYTDPTHFNLTGTEQVNAITRSYDEMNVNRNSKALPADADTNYDFLWYWELNCTGEDEGWTHYLGGNNPVGYASYVNPTLIGDDMGKLFGPNLNGQYIGWLRMDAFSADYAEPIWRTNFFGDMQERYCTVTVKSGLDSSDYPDQTYKVLKGTKIEIPGNIYKRLPKDKHLACWQVGDSADALSYPGETFTVDEDVIFTAQWLEKGKTLVRIVWKDGNDADKVRPHDVDLAIGETSEESPQVPKVTLMSTKGWSGAVDDNVLDDDVENTKLTPISTTDNTFVPNSDADGLDADGQYRYETVYVDGVGFVLTFYHTPNVKATVAGTVAWKDSNNAEKLRPESVKIHLLANGQEVAEKEVTAANVDEKGRWQFNFSDETHTYPQYDENSKIIAYSILVSKVVDSKTGTIIIDQDGDAEYKTYVNDFSVTNFHAVSGKNVAEVMGSVKWDDGEDVKGVRPDRITVHLLANGEERLSQEVKLGVLDLWTFNFGEVEAIDGDGQPISYSIDVDGTVDVDGVSKIIIGNDGVSEYRSTWEQIVPEAQNETSGGEEPSEGEGTPEGERTPEGEGTPEEEGYSDYTFLITNVLVVPEQEKQPSEVQEKPEALKLAYDGKEHTLIKAGSGYGGTIMYALGANGTSAPEAGGFSAELPVGTDAGTYFVWYYVKGDALHHDTEPACVTTEIGKRPATITVANASKVKGAPDPTFTGTVEGLVAEGDLGEVKYVRTNGDEAAGTYEGVLSAAYPANANYDVSVAKGDFTITMPDYSVRFDPNVPASASTKCAGSMDDEHFAYDERKALGANGYVLPGYDFGGWNTKADGTGTSFADKAEVQGLSEDGGVVALYAQWSAKSYKVVFQSDDAGSKTHEQTARFDQPGKLDAYSDAAFGWDSGGKALREWTVTGFGPFYEDGEDFCNLCGAPDADGNLSDAVLTAYWVQAGQIVVTVTRDGAPQEGLADRLVLVQDGVTFAVPVVYANGRYVFDPSQVEGHGGLPAQLPEGDYELRFEADGYPSASAGITYGDAYAVGVVFDYYTVGLAKDTAHADANEVEISGGAPVAGEPGAVVARDGDLLNIKTAVGEGYRFAGYTAVGVAPAWEGGDPTKAEQTIEVQGKTDITAHVSPVKHSVTYKVVNGTWAYGTTDPVTEPVEHGDRPANVPAGMVASPGYTGGAWDADPASATITGDTTFTYTFEKNPPYTVKFDANVPASASTKCAGSMDDERFAYDEKKALSENGYVLPGYDFGGWNTKADGTGTSFADKAEVQGLSEDGGVVALYAQWSAKEYKIILQSDDAGSKTHEQTARFDQPGKLDAYSGSWGWESGARTLHGWFGFEFGSFYEDGEDFCNLCGAPDADGNLADAVLTADWVEAGQIVVTVTKDGAPQEGLVDCLALVQGETTFKVPVEYEDGKYVFDPADVPGPGGMVAQLPPGDYDLRFEADGYPSASAPITYGEESVVGVVFDYYTISLAKDAAHADAHAIEISGGASVEGEPNKVVARDGDTLSIKTTVGEGYCFAGYTAVGVAPVWEGGDPSRAEQEIEVRGKTDITAHVAPIEYSVTWLDGDGSVLQTKTYIEGGEPPVYDGKTPTKTATAQYAYAFAGWDGGTVDGNTTTYRPLFSETLNEYTVRFINDDGTELQGGKVAYGQLPEYSGKAPEKAATAQYTYTFKGWSPEVAAVTGDAVYTATYAETANKYTVTFVDYDGKTVLKEAAEYGYGTPAADVERPADPTRDPDAQYTYAFAGWTPAVADVTADAVYTAVYESGKRSYEISWLQDDGTPIDKTTVEYGEVPAHADPAKAATAQYTYAFSGWTPEVAAVTGDATYKATYTETAKKGTLTFDCAGGTVGGKASLTIEADVGDVITIPEAPVRDGYTFKYWKGSEYRPGDKYTVEGDHAFTAVWEKNTGGGTSGGGTGGATGSSPKTGDALGGTAAALSATAACALVLAALALLRRRRRPTGDPDGRTGR